MKFCSFLGRFSLVCLNFAKILWDAWAHGHQQSGADMKEDYNDFIERFRKGLFELFNTEHDIDDMSMERGLPDHVWEKIMAHRPLSVAIPEEFGGRGLSVRECLGILSTASYESLSLSLTFGINI